MSSDKFLTAKEQVKHSEGKGVQFNGFSKTRAIRYLEENNNYFKLRAFRKNYIKGEDGKYLHLDFADLVDLAIIDNRLRAILLEMAISIEHFSKVHLLKVLQESETSGTQVIIEYVNQLDSRPRNMLKRDFDKNKNSLYCGDLCDKYINSEMHCPVWVFVEIVSFGQYLHFYEFCANRSQGKNKKELLRRLYLMRVVKDLRNACAHNNCIINDLRAELKKGPNQEIPKVIAELGFSKEVRNRHLNRVALYQIITTLYAHKEIVISPGVHKNIALKLHDLNDRFYRDRDYTKNDIIKSSFDVLSKIFNKWFDASEISDQNNRFCRNQSYSRNSIIKSFFNLLSKIFDK